VIPGAFELVVNPSSGRGTARKLLPELEAELDRHGLPYHVSLSRSPADPPRMARRAAEEGRAVVAVGGDGLVGMVADALAGMDATMGVVAAGTGNDFATAMNLPVRDPAEACRVLRTGVVRKIDLGHVDWEGGSRHFVAVAGAGFDSDATRWANRVTWLHGKTLYTVAALRTLAVSSPRQFTITCDDGDPLPYPAWMVAVANSSSYGGGMVIAPRARTDDGRLDLTVVGPLGKIELLRAFPRVFKGTHLSHPRVDALTARTVHLECDEPTDCYADGELCGPLPVTVTIVEQALSLIVPNR
jgi:diacylglycerol kinase (ATP)